MATLDASLLIGEPLLDEEHEQIFNLLGDLLEALHQGRAGARIGQLVGRLAEYSATHFRDEERAMAMSLYPGLADQVAAHRDFTRRIVALQESLEVRGPTCDLSVAVNRLLGLWLREHVRVADAAFGRHLAERRALERGGPKPAAPAAT